MALEPSLGRDDYCAPDVFELERRTIFHRGWYLALRADSLEPGGRTVVDVVGESVLVTRSLDGALHAFANTCRHRGARLCDEGSRTGQGSIMCPYHAWTYALDGRLISTPHLDTTDDERADLALWRIAIAEWQGFVFVSIAAEPPPFTEWLSDNAPELVALTRYEFGALVTGARTVSTVRANWKVIVENYLECLHCTRVHPELVELVPTYRSGWNYDRSRPDGGVQIGGDSFSHTGQSGLPLLPGVEGVDVDSYFGGTIFPNGFIDVTGTSAIVSFLHPRSVDRTEVVTEYLFAPGTVAAEGFDPSPIVAFSELVASQDYGVCERVQLGVASVRFANGVLSEKDDLVIDWDRRYRRIMDEG